MTRTERVAAAGERLQKVLAHAGLGSRREVEGWIEAGRITVNGRVATLGDRVDPNKDQVALDGSAVPLGHDLAHYMLHKPEGVVTTAADPEGRTTVLDLVDVGARVWPVGRLDVATSGLLLLTNDGDLTQRLTHPSYGVEKTYVVEAGGGIHGRDLARLARGVELEDGTTAPARVRVIDHAGGRTLVELALSEGRNRQVRRMFEALGYDVVRLVRTGVGPLTLGRLKPGTFRRLSLEEVRALYRACGL